MGNKTLQVHAKAIANELELILKLLGGTEDERWKAIEILTGITSRAINKIVTAQLEATAQSLKQVNTTLKTLKENVKELSV